MDGCSNTNEVDLVRSALLEMAKNGSGGRQSEVLACPKRKAASILTGDRHSKWRFNEGHEMAPLKEWTVEFIVQGWTRHIWYAVWPSRNGFRKAPKHGHHSPAKLVVGWVKAEVEF